MCFRLAVALESYRIGLVRGCCLVVGFDNVDDSERAVPGKELLGYRIGPMLPGRMSAASVVVVYDAVAWFSF